MVSWEHQEECGLGQLQAGSRALLLTLLRLDREVTGGPATPAPRPAAGPVRPSLEPSMRCQRSSQSAMPSPRSQHALALGGRHLSFPWRAQLEVTAPSLNSPQTLYGPTGPPSVELCAILLLKYKKQVLSPLTSLDSLKCYILHVLFNIQP